MLRASAACRRQGDLARISLGIGDELRDRLRRDRWIDLHDKRQANDACDRCDIADKIKIELVIDRRADCILRIDQQKCVTIGWCTHDRFGTNVAAGARPSLNNELLTEAL